MARFALGLITLYQRTLSPFVGRVCRFEPSCSNYAAAAIEKFGLRKGIFLGAKRIVRCHPFSPGGFDPVK